MILLVSYDLRQPGGDYSGLIEELKECSAWWHYLKSTWIVSTDETPDQFAERLRRHLHKRDRLLVIAVEPGASRQGWLPKKAWDWLRKRLGS